MAYSVKWGHEAEYVLLEYKDRVTKAEQEAGRADAVRMLADKGLKKLFVDAKGIQPIKSLTDDFEFTEDHRTSHPPFIRIAVVHHEDQSERFRFIENVAVNRGMDLKVFTDSVKALNWLTTK